jgi:hypothetical protein
VSAFLRVQVGRAALRAEALARGEVTWAAEASWASRDDLAAAIARLAAEAPGGCRRLRVALERPPVQLRTLYDLPPVRARDLKAVVAHQAARYFRRNGQPLVTDAVWIATDCGRAVRAAAIEEAVLEAVAAGARAAGLALEVVVPANEAAPLVLLPVSERARRERAAGRRAQRLAAAAVAAWAVAGAVFMTRVAWEGRTVERELAALARPLAAALAARRELRAAEAAVRAVAGAERSRGRSLEVLAEIAAALPDSSVVTALVWNDAGAGTLGGAAKRAADVVAALDRADVVPAPRLEGPVIREPMAAREWERFTIAFGSTAHD